MSAAAHPLSAIGKVNTYSTATDSAVIAELAAAQEAAARFEAFSDAVAWEVGTTIRETFVATHPAASCVIHIELFNGAVLFSTAIGTAPAVGPDNWAWVRGKTNVVRKFGTSSLRKGREIAARGATPEQKGLGFPEFACHGGGFPIWLHNNPVAPIGVIVVSGLPELDDHQLIVDSLVKAQHLLHQ